MPQPLACGSRSVTATPPHRQPVKLSYRPDAAPASATGYTLRKINIKFLNNITRNIQNLLASREEKDRLVKIVFYIVYRFR